MTTETLTLVSQGEGRVTGISLPKNPDSPSRKVTLDTGDAGWTFEDQLGNLKAGDLVTYELKRNAENFKKFTVLAPVSHNQRDQTVAPATAPRSDRDDAQGGDAPIRRDLDSNVPAARDVPNSDLQRFEGWAFVANCGMVELAFSELMDACDSGAIDKITPELLETAAAHLLNAADHAQRALVGRTDRAAQSHTRARGAVRSALAKFPLRGFPTDEWAADVTKTATRLLLLAASL